MKLWYLFLSTLYAPFIVSLSVLPENDARITPANIERDIEVGMITGNEPQLNQARMSLVERVKQQPDLVEHLNAGIAEYLGSTLFLFLACGPVTYFNNHATDPANGLMYKSLAFGFALVITARLFGQGLFNNGLNLSFLLLNIITPMRAVILLAAQYGGSITGVALVRLLTGQLAATTRITGISIGRAFVLEALTTSTFLFSVLMLVVKKKQGSLIANIEVGLSLFIHELLTIGYSGGSLNGNRALATDIVQRDFPHYIWIYQLAPICGGLGAAGLYKTIEFLQSLREEVPDVPLGMEIAAFSRSADMPLKIPDGTHDHLVQFKNIKRAQTIDSLSVIPDENPHPAEGNYSLNQHRRKRSDHLKISMVGQNQPIL